MLSRKLLIATALGLIVIISSFFGYKQYEKQAYINEVSPIVKLTTVKLEKHFTLSEKDTSGIISELDRDLLEVESLYEKLLLLDKNKNIEASILAKDYLKNCIDYFVSTQQLLKHIETKILSISISDGDVKKLELLTNKSNAAYEKLVQIQSRNKM